MQHATDYNGTSIGRRSLGGFQFTEIVYSAGSSFPMHSHRLGCFCLVTSGQYRERFRSRAFDCRRSDVVFRPAEENHTDHFGREITRCFVMEFDASWLEGLQSPLARNIGPTLLRNEAITWTAMRVAREFQLNDQFSGLASEGLMLEIVAAASRNVVTRSDRRPTWLKHAVEILHEEFSEKLTLSELAETVGVHPVYLASAFRRHYRSSVGAYVRRLRIEFACQKLVQGDMSLVEIALAAGFAHQAHFSRVFKQVTGLTPAAYRSNFSH